MSATATARSIPWHRRLEARVGAGVVLLVALSLGAILVRTTRAVTARSLERTAGDLVVARSAFYRLVEDRAEFAGAQAALVTALPVFRAHMLDNRLAADVATLDAMVEAYQRQLKADVAIVTDRNGTWLSEPGWPTNLTQPDALRATIGSAIGGRPAPTILAADNRLFLLVSEPARFADELLGTFTVGFALDDAVTRRLAEVTNCEVNLIAGGRLVASSLPADDRSALAAGIAKGRWPRDGVANVVERVGVRTYAIEAFPVSPEARNVPAGRLLLLQDWGPTERLIDGEQLQLLTAGAVIFCLALGASLIFSRRMSRPLQDLATTAEDVAAGNWARQGPVRGCAEAVMMADAFNQMTSSLRHWYEEAKRRDDELRQAQKLEAIGRLAGGVAHDFNNLLTAIRGYAEMLFNGLDAADPRRADADEILKAADRATGLTRQLLAFSRRQIVRLRVVALDRIVADMEQMLGRLIGEDILLVADIAPAIGLVRIDPSQFEQILLNLAVNARDAMPSGGTLRIALANVTHGGVAGPRHSTRAPGPCVRLSVGDTGCGMSPETISHIFEPFYTTKEEGRGTGLGLATVYGIVEQADGAIDIDSEIGRGSTFQIFLPRTWDPEEGVGSKGTPASPAAHGGETVLVVEDDAGVATLIANALEKGGYAVLRAMDGERALAVVRAHAGPIDLLLTDVVMPGMNGCELAGHVTLMRRETRVLYMSGYADDAILRQGIETATVHFIQKPFSMDALTVKMREALTPGSSTVSGR